MKKKLFNELVESIKEGGAILRNEREPSREFVLEPLDVSLIRKNYGLSQIKFARLLGISVATLRNWEQGRRKPVGPARILLHIATKHPQTVLDTVQYL